MTNKFFYKAFEDAHRGSRESVSARLGVYSPILEALVSEQPGGTAIDLGCGRGEWLEMLTTFGLKPKGVDLDEGMLDESRAKGLDVRCQDGLEALNDLGAESVSLVSMFHLVEHLDFQVLLEICEAAYRVLKPGGFILIETPNPENLTVGTNSFYLDPTHQKPIPQQLLKFVLQQSGFEFTEVLRVNHPQNIGEQGPLRLVNVLFHVSPDYAMLAIKRGMHTATGERHIQKAIGALKGLGLEELSERLNAQQTDRLVQLDAQLKDFVENRIQYSLDSHLRSMQDELTFKKYEIRALETAVYKLESEIRDLQNRPGLRQRLLKKLSGLIPSRQKAHTRKNIYVDVSNTAKNGLNTGIERVVRNYFSELCKVGDFETRPVMLSPEGGWHYHFCPGFGDFTANDQNAITPQRGDMVWCLDYNPHSIHLAEEAGLFHQMKTQGIRLVFHVYDILPITHPQFFPPGARETHEKWLRSAYAVADDLICISQAVADDLKRWATDRKVSAKPELHAIHLGANLATPTAQNTISGLSLAGKKFVLSVGTIEPRKGHDQALDAFDLLWAKGSDLAYVIVGQAGWKGLPSEKRQYIEDMCSRITNHPEFGKNLWWFENASDVQLATIYQEALGVLIPSRQEGYGLPLIEAAQQEKPLLVRDIPVFREVAGQHASYFQGNSAMELAKAIEEWKLALDTDSAPNGYNIPYLTWSQSLAATLSSLGLR